MQETGLRKTLQDLKGRVTAMLRPAEALAGRAVDLLARLEPRERALVILAAVLLSILILAGGVYGPLLHYRFTLEKSISAKEEQLKKIYVQSETIRSLGRVVEEERKGQQGSFTLFGFLEGLAVKLSINDRIEYMKPIADNQAAGRETVEVKIRGLSMEDLIGLLLGVESSARPLSVKHLSIKRQEKDGGIDVTFQVVFYG
ncbi:MAG TPA: type II secretion system protein GspM [Deltaproteobacteria bacterium]|nr:type II secretion system protein GspM [Deltaproteobacteria bacterium]HOM29547.1 type II secretion system protein GspM [Deltaproteobacteria bacterium]HPP79999.1 type II secretion system protein GspM [Deltaproteobacteria bacterium]